MANRKVSEMLEASELNSDDLLMVVQEGVNKKVKVNKLQREGEILYESTSGTTGNITLNQNVSNFNSIEIFYKNVDNFFSSVKVETPNKKNVNLSITFINQDGLVLNVSSAIKYINEGMISTVFYGGASGTNVTANNDIKITKVIGYR